MVVPVLPPGALALASRALAAFSRLAAADAAGRLHRRRDGRRQQSRRAGELSRARRARHGDDLQRCLRGGQDGQV